MSTRRAKRPSPIEVHCGTVFLPRGTALRLDGESSRSRLTRQLVEAYRANPGRPLPPEVLASELWPDAPGDATRIRLRVAVHRLRSDGLPVMTLEGGYAIDPRATFVES